MKKKILSIVSEIIESQVDETTGFQDINSLKLLQIIMALDEENITIPLEKIPSIKSVSDIIKFSQIER
jgi:acyl carrier protein